MKKKLLQFFGILAAVLSYEKAAAQTYEPLQVTSGYTADVIANGAGPALSSTTMSIDAADFNFMANDFQPTAAPPPAYALPASGLINSAVTSGLTFQLGPLSGNNSLRIATQTSGTLEFSNAVQASRIYVLATTGSGTATITATINFTDDSSQISSGSVIPDWFFSNALPVAISSFGRVNRNTNVMENPTGGDPRLYQLGIDILPANQLKTIESIQFTKTSSAAGILNVFAVSAELLGACPSPGGLSAVASADAATLSWSPAVLVPADGYDYYYSTSNTPPTAATIPSGNVASGVNTVGLPGLNTGILYYAWVRSNCGVTDKGPWVMVSFTPGQISGTYTAGDVSTLYTASAPSVTSTTTCPAVLSINVPAGYQISSVATSYTMTTASNGWTSEQRSVLRCNTTNTAEDAVSAGIGNAGGTMPYNRSGLTFANGATGTVEFEMRAWRTYGGSGCNTTWNKLDNNWTVTVTYAPVGCVAPASPTAVAQSLCSGATVANLVATGEAGATFKWFTAAAGGTLLPSTTAVSSTTYYVSQTVAGCESGRTPVVVTVTTVSAPTATAQTFCGGATVANLVATGTAGATFKWYAAATGGTELTSGTVLVSGTYYVSQTVEGCESTRSAVGVTVNTVSPPVAANQGLCTGATMADIVVTGASGATFKYYAGATGGTPFPASTPLASATYYVSQTVGTCESSRTPVVVTLTTTAVPTAITQSFCQGATVAGLAATGTAGAEFNWYAGATGGTELASDAALASATYYVSQTVGGCESARIAVAVTVTTLALPTAADQVFCLTGTVADLQVTGVTTASFNWYDTPTGGTALAQNTELAVGSYYVSQSVDGCESAREEVVVTINTTPAPDVEGSPVGCYGITVSDATEGDDDFHIYTSETGGSPLAGEILLTTGTYYVSQSVDGCESVRVSVDITIIELDEPAIAVDQEFCQGATLADVEVGYMTDATIGWYATPGGTELVGTEVLVDGTTYYVAQSHDDCESGVSEITVTVHAIPLSPAGLDIQDFTAGETIASLDITTATGATVTWYVLDGSDYVVVGENTELEDGVTYYCTQSVNGCESTFMAVEANEVLAAASFGFKNLMVYPNPAADVLNVSNDETITHIEVTNLLGQKVMEVSGGGNTMQLNISQLQQGSYILQVYSEGRTAIVKIAKQ